MSLVINPTQFKADYPQFNTVSDDILTGIFDNEVLTSWFWVVTIFDDETVQLYWAYLILAHILTLQPGSGAGGEGMIGVTGTLTSASTGTVSSSFNPLEASNDTIIQWLNMTAYGTRVAMMLLNRGGSTYIPGGVANNQYIYNGYR